LQIKEGTIGNNKLEYPLSLIPSKRLKILTEGRRPIVGRDWGRTRREGQEARGEDNATGEMT
jgi:hypothetical protein